MYIPNDLLQQTYDIYIRRSSDDSEHQVASLESQREVLVKLVKENGLKVDRIVEESMSAKQPGRPIFNEELERIENGTIQGLIVWDLSRCSRNPVDSGTLSWLLQKEQLKVIITPHRIYQSQDNVLLLNIEFGQANQYLRDLSKNVKRGLSSKLLRGWRPGLAPEGYLNDKSEEKGNRTIIIDPIRFPLISKAWDLLLTGNYTVPKILNIMNEEWGYRTVKHKQKGGNKISRTSLYDIFTNSFYYGSYKYGGNWYEGKHEQMITQAEYDSAQAILGRKGKQRPKTNEFAFTGMIRCGECGARITAEEKINRHGSRYIYYHCTKRVKRNCSQRSVELKELENQIDFLFSLIEIPESFKQWAIKYLNELHDQESFEQKVVNKSVDEAYADCITKINNLIKLKISPQNSDGSLNEFVDEQLAVLMIEKKELKAKKDNVDERVEKWLELSEETFNFACYARLKFQHGTLQQKKEILATLGSNFILKDKILSLCVLEPFVAIQKAKIHADRIVAEFTPSEKTDAASQLMYLYAENPLLRRGRDSNP